MKTEWNELIQAIATIKTFPTCEEYLAHVKEMLSDVGLFKESEQIKLYLYKQNLVHAARQLGVIE
jgi:hypothetical protein